MAAGSFPDGEVKVKFRATAPLELAVPDDKVKESVCPKAVCASSENKQQSTRIGAVRHFAECRVISVSTS